MTESFTTDVAVHKRIVEEFAERLDMLEESEQITAFARRLTELALTELATTLGLQFTEADSAQFVTHLAIALTRINRGDAPVEVSAVVDEEIAERPAEREAMARVMTDCARLLEREVPETEVSYMTIHLCAIVDVQNEQSR